MFPTLLALALIGPGFGAGGGGSASGSHTSHATHQRQPHGSGESGHRASGGGHQGSGGAAVGHIQPTGSGSGYGGPPGGPVAYFVVSSPVAPDAAVMYTDESYDTTAGATITQRSWQGRRSSFSAPGVYSVSLTVTDVYGRRSTYSTDVLVSGTTARPPAGQPRAFFLATSPVTAGAPASFTDESYDLDPGARIVDELWTGREPSYPTPGTYAVSLKVEDSTGAWSATFTRDVVVEPAGSSRAAPTSPAPTEPGLWTAEATPDPAGPGTLVTVTAEAPASGAGPPMLEVPASLQGTWDNVSYATTNASGPMAQTGSETFVRSVEVPDSAAFPAGTYDLRVDPAGGGQPVTVALLVQAATGYVEAIVSGA